MMRYHALDYVTTDLFDIADLFRPCRRWWQRCTVYFRSSPHDDVHRQQTQWREWADRLPRSAFIIWLAGVVADELIKSHASSMAELLRAVDSDTAGFVQHGAESFLRRYFFGYMIGESRQYCRMLAVFRRLVKRKIVHSLDRNC